MKIALRSLYDSMKSNARRALAAVLFSSSLVTSSIGIAHDGVERTQQPVVSKNVLRDDQPLDYWIFSDDYCGWASAEPLLSVFRPQVTAQDLADLAKEEPLDVSVTPQRASLTGSSPIIVTIGEGFASYDLTRADQIALRMYPIEIPSFQHIGSRYNGSRDGLAPMDCLGHGPLWHEEVLPSVTVKTAKPMPSVEQWQSTLARVWDNLVQAATALAAQAEQANQRRIAAAANEVAVAAMPQSAGEKLLVRAGIEADAPRIATSSVVEFGAESVCCPVESMQSANLPPNSRQLADVGIASATLQMPQLLSGAIAQPAETNEVARAEAIATAMDTAAATLERLARSLRSAGDSMVRVARAAEAPGRELR